MKLIEFNRQPTDRQLRQFGAATGLFIPFIGWLATGKPHTLAAANLPLLGGLMLTGMATAGVAFARPKVLQPLFILVSLLTLPIGLVGAELVLAIVFFGLFVPLALVFRLLGRDALQRKLDRGSKSYWQPKRQPDSAAGYFRQF